VLTEVTFAENEINDPFIERFTAGLDAVLQSLRPNLTETNFDALLHISLSFSFVLRFVSLTFFFFFDSHSTHR